MSWRCAAFALGVVLMQCSAGGEEARAVKKVAITIDDVGLARSAPGPSAEAAIATALQRASAPVAVFFNCKELDDATLALWKESGATIGNHTATHRSVDESGAAAADDAWWEDVRSCHERLTQQLGEPV